MTDADKKSSNPREIELKFQLMPGSREILEASPALTDAASQHHHQVTTYYDTPDQALNSVGITLRVRKSGRSHIQTVKSRANRRGVATNRNEWEWPIGADCPDLSHLLQTHGLAKIAQAIEGRLAPVFVTSIRRTIRVLCLTDDTIAVLCSTRHQSGDTRFGAGPPPIYEGGV